MKTMKFSIEVDHKTEGFYGQTFESDMDFTKALRQVFESSFDLKSLTVTFGDGSEAYVMKIDHKILPNITPDRQSNFNIVTY